MTVGLWPEQEKEGLISDALFDRPADAIVPHETYQNDLIGWCRDKMGIPEYTLRWSLNDGYPGHVWRGDVDPMVRLAQALEAWSDVGVESCTSSGKTFLAALIVLWFVACWRDARVFTFAPKEDQLRDYIWMEIGKLWPQFKALFPTAELTDLRIRMLGRADADSEDSTNIGWGAQGRSVGVKAGEAVSSKASGMHAKHMLLIYEEMQGQPSSVIEAGENACTAPHNLRLGIGNPNHQLDPLHRFSMAPGVVHVRISAYDHPNVVSGNPDLIPGAVSQKSIDRRLEKYGVESPIFQSRVEGLSPEQSADSLIRLEWLQRSALRWERRASVTRGFQWERPRFTAEVLAIPDKYPKLLAYLAEMAVAPAISFSPRITGKGVDVANSPTGDKRCIVDFAGNAAVRIDPQPVEGNANLLGATVFREMQMQELDRSRVGVDATGVGAGTVNEIQRLLGGKAVIALHSGSPAMRMIAKSPDGKATEWSPDVNMFAPQGGLRSQMYWQLREDYQHDEVDTPWIPDLWEELVTPTFVDYPYTKVIGKDVVIELIGRSPDTADAVVYGNWVRERAIKKPQADSKFDKTPNVARHMSVSESGELVPAPNTPRTLDELVASIEPKRQTRTPFKRLVPTRKR